MSLVFTYNGINIVTNAIITLPIRDIINTGLSINWGDGNTDNNVISNNPQHTYTQNYGVLTITVTKMVGGDFESLNSGYVPGVEVFLSNINKLTSVT